MIKVARIAALVGTVDGYYFNGVPAQSGGSFSMDGLTGQLYGPKTGVQNVSRRGPMEHSDRVHRCIPKRGVSSIRKRNRN